MALSAVTLLWMAIAGVGGTGIGMLARQPEIDKLKAQVKVLQEEVEKSGETIKEALNDIEILKVTAQFSENKEFLYSINTEEYSKALYAYGFYEYLDVKSRFLLDHEELSEKEAYFADFFSKHLNNEIPNDENGYKARKWIKEYLDEKYRSIIENGMLPDFEGLISSINKKLNKEVEKVKEDDCSVLIPEFECFALNEEQTRILYSLEHAKILRDITLTKKDKVRNLKVEWKNKWKEALTKSLDIDDINDYFYVEHIAFSNLKYEYQNTSTTTWYYVLMLEAMEFKPFFEMEGFDSSNLSTMQHQLSSNEYIKILASNQNIIEKKFLTSMHAKYTAVIDNMSDKIIRNIAFSVLLLAGGGIAGVVASVLAPTIAIAAVGAEFSGLYGAALANASLAAIGGGSIATGGLGIAGGKVLITGGAAMFGSTTSSGLSAITSALLFASSSTTMKECSKLVTSVDKVILEVDHSVTLAEHILITIENKITALEKHIKIIENKKEKSKDDKTVLSEFKKSKKYLDKAHKDIEKNIKKVKM